MSTEVKIISATVKATGKKVAVYKLKSGTPTEKHVWCRFGGGEGVTCTQTFTAEELQF